MGLDNISTASLRATCHAIVLSPKFDVERTEYPCKRSIANAARLKMASATMISKSVKPLRGNEDLTDNANVPGCCEL